MQILTVQRECWGLGVWEGQRADGEGQRLPARSGVGHRQNE